MGGGSACEMFAILAEDRKVPNRKHPFKPSKTTLVVFSARAKVMTSGQSPVRCNNDLRS